MLEGRELLSAALVGHRPAVEMSRVAKTPRPLDIYGSLQGEAVESGNGRRGTISFLAAGPEAPVGTGTFNGHAKYKAVTQAGYLMGLNIDHGTGTLTDSNGDKLDLEFSGNVYESGLTYAFSYTGTVIGGTGEFKNAAGNLQEYGTYSIATGEFTVLSYTLTLTHA
jgi:hypothetical protein